MYGKDILRTQGRDKMKKRDKITTSQLLTQIRQSGSFREALEAHSQAEQKAFSHILYTLMEERKQSAKDMIDLTGIHRSYFYAILAGQKLPSRNVVLRLSLNLHCNLSETNQLLILAGLSPLYARVRRDAVLIYAVEKKASMQEVNDMLEEAEEEPLYRS